MNKQINSSDARDEIKKISLYKQIKIEILKMIAEERLAPHAKLPSESALAERYGVSKMVSKMALEALAAEGHIYRKPRSGSYVSMRRDPDTVDTADVPDTQTVANKRLVGVILPQIDPYCADVIISLEKYFGILGYDIVLKISDSLFHLEEQALEDLAQSEAVSGIVLFPSNRRYCGDQLVRMQLTRYPIVIIDNIFRALSLDSVFHNHYKGSYEMTDYLIDHGHERICFLTTDISAFYSRQERLRGFQDAIINRNLIISKDMFYELKEFKNTEHYRTVLKNNQDFTAFFCSDDHIAAQLLCSALELNIKVPQDISIVGFTDNAILRFLSIGITTVRQPINRFCKEVASLLARKIGDPGKRIESIVISTEIVERESVFTIKKE